MPTYKFKDTKSKKTWTEFMTISERDKLLADNPHIEQLVHGAPLLCDPTRVGRAKPDDGFKDVLKEIKKKNRGSTINTW